MPKIAVFMAASLVLAATPGPAVLYIVTRSLSDGRRAGVASALGVATGGFVQVVVAAMGLAALMTRFPVVFHVVRIAGAAYLVYLGVNRIVRRVPGGARSSSPRTLRRSYRDGVVINTLNPKTALFYLSFFPQFIDPEASSVALQILFLGALFLSVALLSDIGYAFLADWLGARVRRGVAGPATRWITGSIYIGLGVFAALAVHPA